MKVRWEFDPRIWAAGVQWITVDHWQGVPGTIRLYIYLPCFLIVMERFLVLRPPPPTPAVRRKRPRRVLELFP